MNTRQLSLPIPRRTLAAKLRQYGVLKAYVFGSYARGEQRPDSDLDLLVEFEPKKTLFDQINLRLDLEELCGRHVDLISRGGLRPRLKAIIEKDLVELPL